MPYDGLLLDFDGVIVDVLGDEERIPLFRTAIDRHLATGGPDLDEDVVDTLARGVAPETLERLSDDVGVPPGDLWRYRDDALASVLERAARDGGKRPYGDVRALRDLAYPVGIASNNQQRVVESILATHDLDDLVGAVRAREPTPESLRRKKPSPTYLEDVMAALDVDDPLFVGDKESDLVAGSRVGIDTALLRREHNAERAIEAEPAHEVTSLEEITALFDA